MVAAHRHRGALSLLLFVAVVIAQLAGVFTSTCEPTPSQITPGPLFKFGVEEKNVICERNDNHTQMYTADGRFCVGVTCFRRHKVDMPRGVRLHVNGNIRSSRDCQPVNGVMLDIFQTNSQGVYGSVHPGEEDGKCRGLIRANGTRSGGSSVCACVRWIGVSGVGGQSTEPLPIARGGWFANDGV